LLHARQDVVAGAVQDTVNTFDVIGDQPLAQGADQRNAPAHAGLKKDIRPESNLVSEKLTLELFQQGRTILEICTERKLKLSTIYTHFSNLIEKGMLKAQDLIYSETIDLILKAKKEYSDKKISRRAESSTAQLYFL